MIMFWILYYGATLLFLLYAFLTVSWRIWIRKYSFLHHAPHIPWLGRVPFVILKDSNSALMQRLEFMRKFNHTYVSWVFWWPLISTGCVEYIEAVMKSKDPVTKSYKVLRELLGDGLVTSTGEKWKKRRHALNGSFNFTILNNFVEIFEKHAFKLIEKLKIVSCNGEIVEIQSYMRLIMLDIICETSMGVSINALDSPNSENSKAFKVIRSLFHKRIVNPVYGNKTLFLLTKSGKKYYDALNTIHKFAINVINEAIADRNKMKSTDQANETSNNPSGSHVRKNKVFIDTLLDLHDKGEIDAEGIHDEVETFIAAGHDTTALSFSWLIYTLGRHPEIQEKVQAEIDEIFKLDCSLMEKIRMLKYTECVIKESLRFNPTVHRINREISKDMSVGENIIPAGTVMIIDVLSLHLNPAYWENPTIFNPERFRADVKRNPYCFLPFSAGPRNCIGQKFAMLELKVFTFLILSTFNVKSPQSPDEVCKNASIVLHSKNGLNINFTLRK